MVTDYDAIIIGAGPAGLTAGLYLARAGKKVLCLEQGAVGGQIITTSSIENYPGFPEGVSGRALIEAFEKQAVGFGLQLMPGRVTGLRVTDGVKEVDVSGFPFTARVVIVATGIVQKLGVPGEEEYLGRGVSYCATCDAALFRGARVAVVGSTDWAVEEALHLAGFVSKLHMVMKPPALKATDAHRVELLSSPVLEVVGSSTTVGILGDGRTVTGIALETAGQTRTLEVDGVFICSGKKNPGTEFLRGVLDLTPQGYVPTRENCETALPGVFAIGDVRRERFHQVATAVGDGATAGMEAVRLLNESRT